MTQRRDTPLPTGTVTFMFTDIENSTGIVSRVGDQVFKEVVERHFNVIRTCLADADATEVSTEGDSLFAVFTQPGDATAAAIQIQKQMAIEQWPENIDLKVRIGLHTGSGLLGGDNYVGADVHRAQRVASAAHGGQILVSSTTASLLTGGAPDYAIEPLGRYRLSGFSESEVLYQVVVGGIPSEFPKPRGAAAVTGVPVPLTELIGRDNDLARLEAMLTDCRLVTLTGPAGTGKTRLSIELGRRKEHEFPDGAIFVPLASLRDPDLIPTTILETIGLSTAPSIDPVEHLERFLGTRGVLLILDNFEHLLEGATVVSRLLASSTELKIIATSRTAIRIAGECEFHVPPLDVPGEAGVGMGASTYPGVALFASRAAAVRPDFELTADNVGVVSSIARSLDGLPLAIELAASRMRVLTPELILSRLGNSLLSTSASDVPERQRTIFAAVGWSYDLLDEPTRVLFEKVSVFSGSFGLDEAELVCADESGASVLDRLIDLVESSLLLQTQRTGDVRFRMLSVIREYAYAALVTRGLDETIRDRHARAYLSLAERAESEILTSRQGYWLDLLTEDHDNLRAAFDHAVDKADATVALGLVGAMWRFWQIRGHLTEGRRRAEMALAMPDGDDRARAKALTALGGILYWQGEWGLTLRPYESALAIVKETGSEEELADALYNMAFPLLYAGEQSQAESLLQQSLTLNQKLGREIGIGRALWGLGDAASFREDWEEVIELTQKAAERFDGLDAPFDQGWSWFMIAHGHLKAGRAPEAEPFLLKALQLFAVSTDLSGLILVFESLSYVAFTRGELTRCARLAGAAHRIKADTGISIAEVEQNQFSDLVDFIANRDEVIEAAYQEGWATSVEEVVAEVIGSRPV
mgnify:FL=1